MALDLSSDPGVTPLSTSSVQAVPRSLVLCSLETPRGPRDAAASCRLHCLPPPRSVSLHARQAPGRATSRNTICTTGGQPLVHDAHSAPDAREAHGAEIYRAPNICCVASMRSVRGCARGCVRGAHEVLHELLKSSQVKSSQVKSSQVKSSQVKSSLGNHEVFMSCYKEGARAWREAKRKVLKHASSRPAGLSAKLGAGGPCSVVGQLGE